MANDYTALFQEAGKTYNVDPQLLRAVVQVESGGNPNAVSEQNAQGVAQIIPATQKALGVKNPFDPRESIFGAAKLLDENLTRYGNPNDAILAYHGGTDQRNWGPKTRAYLEKVTSAYGGSQGSKMPSSVNTIGEMGGNEDAFTAYFSGKPQAAQAPANDPFTAYFGNQSAQPVKTAAIQQLAQATPQRSAFDETARQVGLTGRAAVTGLTSLPTMAGDALNSLINMGIGGVNRLAGTNIPQLQMPSEVTQRAMNAVGVPQPQNATERVVQDVAGALAGTGGQYRLGKALLNVPAATGLSAALTTAPGAQLAGAAGGAVAQGTAREEGAGIGGQLAAGLLGSAVPVIASSAATSAIRRMNTPTKFAPITPEQAPEAAVTAAKEIARETGTKASTVDTKDLAAALVRNPTADPKALARQADFQALGMDGTLGQVTRDAGQFARERNIRGVQGVGEPVLARLANQNNQLQEKLNILRGEPMEPYHAGQVLSEALASADEGLRQQVSSAYQAARQSTGKDLNVPLQGLAQKYAETLKTFGDKIPGAVRSNFEELGLISGKQRKVFTIEDADGLSKIINANHSNDPATNKALGELNQAVKNAVLSADPKGGPFAPAVKLAKARFDLQDAIPALKDAAQGKTAADDFVKRFVVNGKTDEVRGMADLLKQTAPDAFAEARNQLGNELNRAAFGANVTGDKLFAPERYAEAVRRIGTAKLGAFFTPDEVADIQRIGRVGAYINSFPSAAPVSTSNSGVVVENLLRRVPNALEHAPIPGAKILGAALRTATKGIEERQFVADALKADLAKAGNRMTPEQAAFASKLLLQPAVRVPPVKP